MKKIILHSALFVFLLISYSCKKTDDDTKLKTSNNFKVFNKTGVTPNMPQPGGEGGMGTPIVKGSDGIYRCSYRGLDLNFGTSLYWPLNVEPWQNGTAYNSSPEFHDSNNMILSYTMVSGRFALVIASGYSGNGSLHTAITNYYKAFSNFVNRVTNPETGQFLQSTLPQFSYGGSPTASVITGQLVLDSSSPTHLSISPVTYIIVPPID